MFDIVIIGGGPAGMMAAVAASEANSSVCLLERNATLGNKLLLTGRGRCNLTSSKTIPEIVEMFGKKSEFLYSAFSQFSNIKLMNFFESRGVKLKIERGGRVFPEDNKAYSVLRCLKDEMRKNKVSIIFNFRAVKVTKIADKFFIQSDNGEKYYSKTLIVATGGKSYPETGSTGDGYEIAKSFGHTIEPLRPALAALFIKDNEIRKLAGLDLNNVNLSIISNGNKITNELGDMLFTHQGITGPIVLNTSKYVFNEINFGKNVVASVDLKPALDRKTLEIRIRRDIESMPKKEYLSLLKELLPRSLIPLFAKRSGIPNNRKCAQISNEEIVKIIDNLKNFEIKIDGVAPIETAIVTSGGVPIEEINQKTMESKIVSGLFFAGEIIALDAPTGGYNLQKAFSTGFVAGYAASHVIGHPAAQKSSL